MKLLTMNLENFQRFQNLTLNFNGVNKTLRGNNAAGKTTIANAQSWLLTGKSSTDEKNYTPKTKESSGLDHSVECTYQLEDGSVVSLKKVFKEKYTKKRGSTTAEFSGHEVSHYIDGVPVKEKEYQEYLKNKIGDVETILMLTNASYFSETMKWDKRRKLLLEMCGDYSDDYIIASNPKLLDLKTVLLKPGNADQYYSVEEYMKITKEQMKKINNEIQAIPARIDEAKRAIPEIDNDDKEALESKIAEVTLLHEDKGALKAELLRNDADKLKREKIAEIQMRMQQARIDHQAEYSNQVSKIQDEINMLSSEVNDIRMNVAKKDRSIQNSKNDLQYMKDKRTDFINQYNEKRELYVETASKEWDSKNEICPTCHQELPLEKIEELKAHFNLKKSERLGEIKAQIDEINKRGQSVSAAAQKEVEDLIEKLEKEKEILGTDLILKNQEIQRLEQSKPQRIPFESTNAYALYSEELRKLNDETVVSENEAEIEKVNVELNTIKDQLNALLEQQTAFKVKEFQLKRIEELKALQHHLGESYEQNERHIFLCEEFIKTKVSMVTERINERFKNISFKLFDIQVNGGLKECCELMIPSPDGINVEYSSSNDAAKYNAGLEVIETLQEHFKVKLPVFVDNAESVTELNNIDTQIIRLVVDANHKKLYMEE